MTFSEQVNAAFASPSSRTKLITLRHMWNRPDCYVCLHEPGDHTLSYPKLVDHLRATAPHLIPFVEQLTQTTGLHLDALLKVSLRIPLDRSPIITVTPRHS